MIKPLLSQGSLIKGASFFTLSISRNVAVFTLIRSYSKFTRGTLSLILAYETIVYIAP